MKMFNKINIFKIISNHFNTLQNDNTKKCEFDDILTFLILPLLVSVGLYWFDFELKENAINIIITTLSIFVGLLFNIIVIHSLFSSKLYLFNYIIILYLL